MRSNGLIFIVGILFIVLTDTFLFLEIKKYLRKKIYRLLYGLHTLLFLTGLLAYHLFIPALKGPAIYYWVELGIGILLLFYLPKVLFLSINTLGLLFGLLFRSLGRLFRKTALIISLALFLLLLYSITWGRYNYKLETETVCLKQLPSAFEGFKIVQLSDLHLGSYSAGYKGLPKLIREVNALHPDLIVFTGDMVNNFASEMDPWIAELRQLQAKYGKFAITGNHDYGDYTRWSSPEKKIQNRKDFFRNMEAAGFTLLNNRHIPLSLAKDTLYLAGVENWGNPPFPRYGDLSQALQGAKERLTILLSHDPSHWKAEVLGTSIPLTLSGHTHAMQMGFKMGNYKWSPSQYIYPEFDGLYRQGEQYLYVSRGQGYLGFPGRIGLRPVITEIILTRNCD